MGRKRNPYLPLYTRDIMSSPRCRALSTAAAGVYLFLLCRLNEPPTPGAFRLSDWEQHPNWRRSLTQQCLANADKYGRLQYFARCLSKNDLPWDKKDVLLGLQELYRMGIIVIEDDMLVQPRMYKDNGFSLSETDSDSEPKDTILDEPASGSMVSKGNEKLSKNNGAKKRAKNGTKKVFKKEQKNDTNSRARASRALSVEYENNNIRDNKEENIDRTKAENEKTTPKKKQSVADNPPTIEDIKAYFAERAQQNKPFLYVTPDTFFDACEQSGWRLKDGKPMVDWRARVRTFENYRRDRGDKPVGQTIKPNQGEAVPASEPRPGKYKKW